MQCKIIALCRDGKSGNLDTGKLKDILHSLKEENESLLQDIEHTLNSDSPES